jgi:hypothetical protein
VYDEAVRSIVLVEHVRKSHTDLQHQIISVSADKCALDKLDWGDGLGCCALLLLQKLNHLLR